MIPAENHHLLHSTNPGSSLFHKGRGDFLFSLGLLLISLSSLSTVCLLLDRGYTSIGTIQTLSIFGSIDDASRFFYYLQAFNNPDLYKWSFIQPVSLFFEGMLASILHQDIFWMRLAQAFLASLSLVALHQAGRHLGVRRLPMFGASLSLLFMPLYAIVSVSFYGEALLTADICFLLYFYSKNQQTGLILTSSIAPLIRPEGLFFLLAILVYQLAKRNIRNSLLILLPGLIYACYLLASQSSLDGYMQWRFQLLSLRETIFSNLLFPDSAYINTVSGNLILLFTSINIIWWGLALCGLVKLRQHWPLYAGALFYLIIMTLGVVITKTSIGEPRYLLSALPVLTLGIGASLHALHDKISISKWPTRNITKKIGPGLILLILLVPVSENLAQSDPIRYQYFGNHRWPFMSVPAAVKKFTRTPADHDEINDINSFIKTYTSNHHHLAFIAIADMQYLKQMSPVIAQQHQVILFPIANNLPWELFNGDFFGMSPAPPQYHYYRFSPAGEQPPDAPIALYVGWLPDQFSPVFHSDQLSVYEVRFDTFAARPSAQDGTWPQQ